MQIRMMMNSCCSEGVKHAILDVLEYLNVLLWCPCRTPLEVSTGPTPRRESVLYRIPIPITVHVEVELSCELYGRA